MQTLLNEYKNKYQSVMDFIATNKNNGSINDERRTERVNTKAAEYRSFIADIEKAIKRTAKGESDKSNKLKSKVSETLERVEAVINEVGCEMNKLIDEEIASGKPSKRTAKMVNELDAEYNELKIKRKLLRHLLAD